MKRIFLILLIIIGFSIHVEAQISLRFGTPGVQYNDTTYFGDFVSFAYWIVNEGPDTLSSSIDMNLMVTDSVQTNNTFVFLGDYSLTNNFLAPSDSLFIVSWDHISPMRYSSGDNIVVIWPNFISPTIPFTYEIFTGEIFVSNNTSVLEKWAEEDFQIFPNPMVDQAKINTIHQLDLVRCRLIDLSGKIIKELVVENQNYLVINRNGLNSGTYIVEIITEKQKYYQKLIIN